MQWTTAGDAAEQQPRAILSRLGYRSFDFEILTDRQPRQIGASELPPRFVVTRKRNGVSRTYDERTCAAEFERDLVSGLYGDP